jgi:DNA-binding beta-propeller fold protein YncE
MDMGKLKLILGASILLLVSGQVNASVISISSTPLSFVQEFDLETGVPTNTYSYSGETFQPSGVAYRRDGTVYTTGNSDNISIFATNQMVLL